MRKMETVKETKEFKIYKKKTGRYCVKASTGKWMNGEEKVKVLLGEGLIKVTAPTKKEEEAPAEEAAAE